jgi:hypothetical protein
MYNQPLLVFLTNKPTDDAAGHASPNFKLLGLVIINSFNLQVCW